MELRCTNFQKKFVAPQEEVKVVNSLKKAKDIHCIPYTLAAHVIELEGSLKDDKKRYKSTSDYVEENTRHMEEHRKTILNRLRLMQRP